MPESAAIPRRRGSDDPAGFENLRRLAIEFVQEATGKNWTDYNVHDPGVTILEQVCYAVTDLIYRTGFPIQDYLTGPEGKIDFEKQGLVLPHRIFPSRPTTIEDYRKVLIDSIPEIDNVWLQPDDSSIHRGLYDISVRLAADVADPARDEVLSKVHSVYQAHRNLCEDAQQVRVLDEVECELEARIELEGSRPPDDVAAEIYYRTAGQIAQVVHFHSFDAERAAGSTLDELFTGPLTRHGILRGSLGPGAVHDPTPDLFPVVNGVGGVRQIRHLTIRPVAPGPGAAADRGLDSQKTRLLRLRIPATAEQIHLTLVKNSRSLPLTAEGIRTRYDKLSFEQRAIRTGARDFGPPAVSPPGQFRELDRYSSIQNHFPAIYGLGEHGVGGGAEPEARVRAMQLKAYLLLFDQIMANFTANLAHFRQFLSPQVRPLESYRPGTIESGPPSEGRVGGLDRIYTDAPGRIIEEVFVDAYDRQKAANRKSRVLDYLLALYGEKFTQSSLRHYSFYADPEAAEDILIENKLRRLGNVVELTRDRGAGATASSGGGVGWTGASGLERNVRILLGFHTDKPGTLTAALQQRNLTIDDTEPPADASPAEDMDDAVRVRMRSLPPLGGRTGAGEDGEMGLPRLAAGLIEDGRISGRLMRELVFRDRYRVGPTNGEFVVMARTGGGPSGTGNGTEKWIRLGSCPSEFEAYSEANALRRFLIGLNTGSEGLHVVEHLLLRHSSGSLHSGVPADFHEFRVSVVFPAWTARTTDTEFRNLAEETVRLNCPAHVSAGCLWLGFEAMAEFERLLGDWTEARLAPSSPDELDSRAKDLVSVLRDPQTS